MSGSAKGTKVHARWKSSSENGNFAVDSSECAVLLCTPLRELILHEVPFNATHFDNLASSDEGGSVSLPRPPGLYAGPARKVQKSRGAVCSKGGCMRRFGTAGVYACALALVMVLGAISILYSQSTSQAPTGFTTPTLNSNSGSQSTSNGFPEPAADTFANDQSHFEEQDGVDNGLGPVYNAQSCVNCHQNPVSGGTSQVTELRVGHDDAYGNFVNPTITINNGANTIPNRSLINDRAVCPQAQERVPGSETIHALRASLNTLGDGFVESIDSNTLYQISLNQPSESGGYIAGEFIQVPVLEAPGEFAAAVLDGKTSRPACCPLPATRI